MPYHPYKDIPDLTHSCYTRQCKFPSFAELNEEIVPWDSGEHTQVYSNVDKYIIHEAFPSTVDDIVPPKLAPPQPVVPDIGLLSADLLTSDDILFLIYHTGAYNGRSV